MHINKGIYEEEEMVLLFNNKKLSDLSNNAKHFAKEMFGHLDGEKTFISQRVGDYMKPDFSVSYGDETHFVSMKTGRSNTVHQEYVMEFCKFLRTQGISNRTLQTILLYHYGDGTLDGSGKQRMQIEKLKFLLASRIKEANAELNSKKDFVLMIIERAVLKGTREENIEADYIYHGNSDYGVLVSKTQLLKHCNRRDWKWMDNLHIGPILLNPHARYIGKEIKREKSRQRLEFSWPNFREDLEYISSRYDG